MPKLPPDEKLFTAEQQARFKQPCFCGYTFGEHKADGLNCPGPTSPSGAKQWMGDAFRTQQEEAQLAAQAAPRFWVGDSVRFGAHATKIGTVVELVPAGRLPMARGLRHISDKRRTPKPRDCISYVVSEGNMPATRATLYWPNTFGLSAV